MSSDLTPLQVCERLIGKPEWLAEAIGVAGKVPFAWRHPSKGRDAGDIPSARHMRALLAYSETHGLGLTAEHLVRGAAEAEIEDILSSLGTLVRPSFSSRRKAQGLEAAE